MKLCAFRSCAHTPDKAPATFCITHQTGVHTPDTISTEYLEALGDRLLSHRYRYYVLDDPELVDYEYDYLETYYEKLCAENGVKSVIVDMVGYDMNVLKAKEAAKAVEAWQDYYSVWLDGMFPTWRRIGLPEHGLQLSNRAQARSGLTPKR